MNRPKFTAYGLSELPLSEDEIDIGGVYFIAKEYDKVSLHIRDNDNTKWYDLDGNDILNLIDVPNNEYKAINIKQFGNDLNGTTYKDGSVDLGFNNNENEMGRYSFRVGYNSIASGLFSFTSGDRNISSGISSTTIGVENIASNFGSTSWGWKTKSEGRLSTSWGEYTVALGDNSTSFGYGTKSIARYSTAMGYDTESNGRGSLSIGMYTTKGGDLSDELFKVGNGTTPINLKNAYVLYNDGTSKQEGIAEYMSDISDNFTDLTLVTKMYVDNTIADNKTDLTGYATENWVITNYISKTHPSNSITNNNILDWNKAFNEKVNTISFTGDSNKTLTVTREDGTTLTASFLDNSSPEFPDDVINTLQFNENNDGVLRAITSQGAIIDTSIDGRYSLLGHTHTFSSITNKPTTIGGYGITDFNSLGDSRWTLRSTAVTGIGGLTGGGSLSEDRTIDLNATTKADIALGKTAHGWGNHASGGYLKSSSNTYMGSYRAPHNASLGTLLESGSYRLGTGSTDAFPGHAYSNILTVRGTNADTLIQIGGSYSDDRLFFRSTNINNIEGKNWSELWHDGNLRSDTQNDSRYVSKSGDTMTSRLTISNGSYGNHLRLIRGSKSADVSVGEDGQLALEAPSYILGGLSGTSQRMVVVTPSGVLAGVTQPTSNATHTGDATGSTSLTIANNLVPRRSTTLGTTNIDTLNTPNHAGFYYQPSSANATLARGYPATTAGNLRIYRDAGVVQIYNLYNSIVTFRRHYYNNVWSNWLRIDVGAAVNTTYTTGTLAQLNAGTDGVGRLQSAKLLNDWGKSKFLEKVNPSFTGTYPIVVNVDNNTVYSNTKLQFRGSDGTMILTGKIEASQGFYETSDKRLKSNIKNIGSTLKKALKVPAVTYEMDKTKSIGTIAQDVQELFPELVNTNEEGMLSVNYSKLSVVAIQAIRELNEKVEYLLKKLKDE